MEPERQLAVAAVTVFQEGVGLYIYIYSSVPVVGASIGTRELVGRPWLAPKGRATLIRYYSIQMIQKKCSLELSLYPTNLEDGSIEEVAEKIMIMHEECSIESLREANNQRVPTPHVTQVVDDDDDNDDIR